MSTRALIDIFFSWNSLTNMAFEFDQRLWIRCGSHFSPLRFLWLLILLRCFFTIVFLNLNKNKTEKLIFNARNGIFFFQYGISFSIECSKTTVHCEIRLNCKCQSFIGVFVRINKCVIHLLPGVNVYLRSGEVLLFVSFLQTFSNKTIVWFTLITHTLWHEHNRSSISYRFRWYTM